MWLLLEFNDIQYFTTKAVHHQVTMYVPNILDCHSIWYFGTSYVEQISRISVSKGRAHFIIYYQLSW